MYKINGVIQKDSSPKRNQQLQALKAGFINLRLISVAAEVINSQLKTVEEENA